MFTFSFHPDFHKQSTRRLTAGGFGKVYDIASDGIPFLEIETNPNSWNPFNAAWFFQQCFCIGSGNEVYFIHLQTGKIKTVSCDMYFGSFHIHKDRLYIASSSRLFCFDSDCELVWKSEEIAVDGVIVNDFQKLLCPYPVKQIRPAAGFHVSSLFITENSYLLYNLTPRLCFSFRTTAITPSFVFPISRESP